MGPNNYPLRFTFFEQNINRKPTEHQQKANIIPTEYQQRRRPSLPRQRCALLGQGAAGRAGWGAAAAGTLLVLCWYFAGIMLIFCWYFVGFCSYIVIFIYMFLYISMFSMCFDTLNIVLHVLLFNCFQYGSMFFICSNMFVYFSIRFYIFRFVSICSLLFCILLYFPICFYMF